MNHTQDYMTPPPDPTIATVYTQALRVGRQLLADDAKHRKQGRPEATVSAAFAGGLIVDLCGLLMQVGGAMDAAVEALGAIDDPASRETHADKRERARAALAKIREES